jgi:hypothetical protein
LQTQRLQETIPEPAKRDKGTLHKYGDNEKLLHVTDDDDDDTTIVNNNNNIV